MDTKASESVGSMKLFQATLTNIAEGELEQQFQERLKEIVPIFADPRPYVQSKEGETTVKIKMELEMVQGPDGVVILAARSELVRPKRRGAIKTITRRGAEWLVGYMPKQEPLPFAVRAVPSGESAGGE
jgi:hypothetical protein